MKFPSSILPLIAMLMVAPTNGADRPKGKPAVKDMRKSVIELPLKGVVARSAPAATPTANTPAVPVVPVWPKGVRRVKDAGKYAIEVPLKRVVAGGAQTVKKQPAKASSGDKSAGFQNPKVEPGKVNWHANFDKAVAAAVKSRKPVLLFQMIGNLDERFS